MCNHLQQQKEIESKWSSQQWQGKQCSVHSGNQWGRNGPLSSHWFFSFACFWSWIQLLNYFMIFAFLLFFLSAPFIFLPFSPFFFFFFSLFGFLSHMALWNILLNNNQFPTKYSNLDCQSVHLPKIGVYIKLPKLFGYRYSLDFVFLWFPIAFSFNCYHIPATMAWYLNLLML